MIQGQGSMLGIGLVMLGLFGLWFVIGRVTLSLPAHGRRARRRLERGLGLGFRDRRLLQRLARSLGVADRTSLLLGRGCFEDAVRRMAPGERLMPRIESLRNAIFDIPIDVRCR